MALLCDCAPGPCTWQGVAALALQLFAWMVRLLEVMQVASGRHVHAARGNQSTCLHYASSLCKQLCSVCAPCMHVAAMQLHVRLNRFLCPAG